MLPFAGSSSYLEDVFHDFLRSTPSNPLKFKSSHHAHFVDFFQIKYSFEIFQKSNAKLEYIRKTLNDPKWRPPPLQVAIVSSFFIEIY